MRWSGVSLLIVLDPKMSTSSYANEFQWCSAGYDSFKGQALTELTFKCLCNQSKHGWVFFLNLCFHICVFLCTSQLLWDGSPSWLWWGSSGILLHFQLSSPWSLWLLGSGKSKHQTGWKSFSATSFPFKKGVIYLQCFLMLSQHIESQLHCLQIGACINVLTLKHFEILNKHN